MSISGFDHVAVPLGDVEAMLRFYESLGFRIVPLGDGLVEDRRVGGDPGDAQLDEAGEFAGADEGAGQVVEPDLLAGGTGA